MSNLLYHYCSTQTFHALFSAVNPAIRLSSLSLSNDAMEGRWIRKVFKELCADEGLSIDDIASATNFMDGLLANIDGLGFCLSEEADMLSQWRGYADDAKGFCIGFSQSYLAALRDMAQNNFAELKLERVIYDRDEQIALITPIVRQVRGGIDNGVFRPPQTRMVLDSRTDEEIELERLEWREAIVALGAGFLEAYFLMFRLKNHAFREEKEWRILTPVKSDYDSLQYHPKDDRLVPYANLFFGPSRAGAICEVIIGPKNITPLAAVAGFLKEHGFGDVKVRKSDASYR